MNKISKNHKQIIRIKLMRKSLIWLTINAIFLFSLSNFEQGIVQSSSENHSAVFISYANQNSIEQNLNERNLRQKNSENFKIATHPIFCSVSNQIEFPSIYQLINLTRSFGSIFISSDNNHSLRSPPVFS